jgi:glycosyltransferase involved in cell wall biosynthesis
MLPKVAIICANYNYGDFIIPAIESIVNQTYEGPLGLYVVDDGSSDDSWSKLSSWKAIKSKETYLGHRKLDNVHFERISNSGASVARNTAIEMCWDWADIIGVLDADDAYKPTKVEKLVEKLMEYPEVGVAYGDYDIHRSYGDKHYVKYEAKGAYCRRGLSQSCMVHSNALIKKEYLEKVILPNGEIFDSRLHGPASQGFIGCTEDYDLWLRLSHHCIMCHVPESLSIVNESGQNQSMKMTPEIFQQQAQILGSR